MFRQAFTLMCRLSCWLIKKKKNMVGFVLIVAVNVWIWSISKVGKSASSSIRCHCSFEIRKRGYSSRLIHIEDVLVSSANRTCGKQSPNFCFEDNRRKKHDNALLFRCVLLFWEEAKGRHVLRRVTASLNYDQVQTFSCFCESLVTKIK